MELLNDLPTLHEDGTGWTGDVAADRAWQMCLGKSKPAQVGRNDTTQSSVSQVHASATYWIEKGVLKKFQVQFLEILLQPGSGVTRPYAFDNTIEIKDIGATSIVVPNEIKATLGIPNHN